MKIKKSFLVPVLSLLAISALAGCNSNKQNNNGGSEEPEEEEQITFDPQEIGDTVKEWKDRRYYDELPIDIADETLGSGDIYDELGMDDDCSLRFDVKEGSYLGSDVLETPFFTDDDAKNGDVISLYFYAPSDSNLKSIELEVLPYSMNNGFKSKLVEINDDNTEQWVRLVVEAFDTLEPLGAIRVNYKAVDPKEVVTFYIDDINVTLGEETQKTGYEYNDESLYKAYEEYGIKIGGCLSNSMMNNTTMRTIAKHNFNSITAENEGKPEQILDQQACQALAAAGKKNEVAISLKSVERIYSFCEAHHIKVRHHTFVWYSQTPGWLFTEDYTNNGKQADRNTMLYRMDNFIRETMQALNNRWPGLVYAYDVVNEASSNGGAGYNQGNKWFDTVGDDFVYQAFLSASTYREEEQELYYNDYDFDYDNDSSKIKFAFDNYLKRAVEEGIIDGVGIQGHIDCDNIRQDIATAKYIKEKGLKCQITELDITTNNNEAGFAKQKEAYKNLCSQILELNKSGETDVNAIIVWGITDDTSWKRGQNPLLFNSDFSKKPAYYGVLEAAEEFN